MGTYGLGPQSRELNVRGTHTVNDPSLLRMNSVSPLPQRGSSAPRVLIVAEHASFQFGGEAALPLHYYGILRGRGDAVWLLCHARTRTELERLFPDDRNIEYVEDTPFVLALYYLSKLLPDRLASISTGFLMRLSTQVQQKRIARRLIAEHSIDVVHQPLPVSPKEPSLMYGFSAPVVIGPMNGGMSYPPAFRSMDGILTRTAVGLGRAISGVLNCLLPGKRRAAALIVANERTRVALPASPAPVYHVVENAVDVSVWAAQKLKHANRSSHLRLVFMGRLVDWKAVDLLIEAFKSAATEARMSLTILGDGEERSKLEELARGLGLWADTEAAGYIWFAGWRSQADCAATLRSSDALVLPSLFECGGAVVLEAMAAGLPVIATNWGGPGDYLDASCGILVDPNGRETFKQGLAAAMIRLAHSPQLREQMGAAGQAKVKGEFDWEKKVDRLIEIYKLSINAGYA